MGTFIDSTHKPRTGELSVCQQKKRKKSGGEKLT
jgi:hypothetical protein